MTKGEIPRRGRRRPAALDLFAGAGGLSLGLRRAGFRVVGAIENDWLAVETYRRNHRGTRVWADDIRDVSVVEVRRRLRLRAGKLALLAGCPPCQGFSSMRTLNGRRRIRDRAQKDLLLEFLRFVRGLRPKAIMLENVPGLGDDHRFARFRSALRKLGYAANWQVLNAADYGVPQRRRRLIYIAWRAKTRPIFAPTSTTENTVRDAIGQLPSPRRRSRDPLHTVREKRSSKVRELIRKIPKNGGSRTALSQREQLECHKRLDGFKDVYGRMSWDELSPTITCGFVNPSKGRFLHPVQNRAITLREAALLQTFPRYYFFSLRRGKFAAAGLIGNALPPRFIRRLATPVYRHVGTGSAR